MDTFPDYITLENCKNTMVQNQLILVRKEREKFTNLICRASEDCNDKVELDFDKKLYNQYRISIANELLERFGGLYIINTHAKVHISFPNSIDKNNGIINKIIIDFSL